LTRGGLYQGFQDEFLQGLMIVSGPIAQDRMNLGRHVFDLDVWHGSIMAPSAEKVHQL